MVVSRFPGSLNARDQKNERAECTIMNQKHCDKGEKWLDP